MENTLIKTYEIPESVRKKFAKFLSLELYTDRLVGKGNKNGDIMFFFKDYIDVTWTPACVANMYALVTFLTAQNSGNVVNKNMFVGVDANRIPFCSGTFSYKPANEYAKALCMDIKAAMNEYKLNANNTTTTATVVQAAPSSAEELKKFKELLDAGIITQEEFDAKKKQLLGL